MIPVCPWSGILICCRRDQSVGSEWAFRGVMSPDWDRLVVIQHGRSSQRNNVKGPPTGWGPEGTIRMDHYKHCFPYLMTLLAYWDLTNCIILTVWHTLKSIGSNNALAPNRWQAVYTNQWWRSSLGLDELKDPSSMRIQINSLQVQVIRCSDAAQLPII